MTNAFIPKGIPLPDSQIIYSKRKLNCNVLTSFEDV